MIQLEIEQEEKKMGICLARPISDKLRRQVLAAHGKEKCPVCNVKMLFREDSGYRQDNHAAAQVDHIYPRSKCGRNNRRNLRVICRECNRRKSARVPYSACWCAVLWMVDFLAGDGE